MSYVDGQRFAFFYLICLMFACDDVQPLNLTLSIENRSLVLGQDVQINAISSQKVNIEWKIIQRPNGSTNPIEAIDVLDGYQSHFLPDKLGQYTILATAKTSESSKSATISVEINCAPPAWDIELNTPQGLIGQIGQQTDLFANLKTIDQVGCEGIEPLSPMISWRLISKPT